MRILLIWLILASSLHAQIWTPVAAPTTPLVFVNAGSNYTWSYPFVNPSPAGTYEVSNAIVDKSHRVGAWSQPTRITVKSGWLLYGVSWNQPPTSDEAGIAWKIKCIQVNETADFRNGAEHYLATSYEVQSVTPWSGSAPEIQPLYLMWQRFQTVGKLPVAVKPAVPATVPIVVASAFPNISAELAYCRVTETGETELSPPVQYTPPILPGMLPADTCQVQLLIQEPHPQGTIGYHVYWRPVNNGIEPKDLENKAIINDVAQKIDNLVLVQKINTPDFSDVFTALAGSMRPPIGAGSQPIRNATELYDQPNDWQRLPAPHCYGEPATPDDWLWQIWDKQPKVIRTVENAPIHTPVAKPQSRLCDLQIKLSQTTGNITVPAGVTYETYCPVIDEWRVEGIFYTFGRTVKTADGGKWWIKAQASLGGHSRWPGLAIYNQYSTWIGVQTGSSIAFADWSGGQSFGVRFNDCSFGSGLLIHSRSAGSSTNLGGHTASELEFTNCMFASDEAKDSHVPIWIGGQQSANIRFNRTHCHAMGSSRRSSAVFLDCGNQIRFTGGFYVECPQGGAIFRANNYPANLLIDDIWVDQGFHCFLETSHTTCAVKFRGGKLNCWAHDPFEELTLARLIDSPPALSRLIFEDVQVQFNFTPAIDVISPHYNLCELRFTDTALADVVWLREPTKAQEQARANAIYPWGYPAVPTREVPGLRLSSTSSVNSFTNRAKVQRDNWTAEAVKP